MFDVKWCTINIKKEKLQNTDFLSILKIKIELKHWIKYLLI